MKIENIRELEDLLRQVELCYMADTNSIIAVVPLENFETLQDSKIEKFYDLLRPMSPEVRSYYNKRFTDLEDYWGGDGRKAKGIRGISG